MIANARPWAPSIMRLPSSAVSLFLLTASASACASDEPSGADPDVAALSIRIDELETTMTTLQGKVSSLESTATMLESTVATFQSTATSLSASIIALEGRMPLPLGRISLACATDSSCTVQGVTSGPLSHAGGGLRFTIPNTAGKTVLVLGRINLEMTGGNAATDGICQYTVIRTNGGTTAVMRSAIYSVPSDGAIAVPLTFAGTYHDNGLPDASTNLIEVTFAGIGGGATCAIAAIDTADFDVIAFGGLPSQ